MQLDTAPTAAPTPNPARTSAVQRLFGGLPRQFWIVALGTLVNRMGGVVVPFLVFFLGSRGVSEDATGYIVAALGVGGLAGSVVGGWLADRVGARSALIFGLLAVPAALGVLYVMPSAILLGVAAILVGLAGRLFPPAAGALVARSVSGERRTRAFMLVHWAVNIGVALGAGFAGFFAARGYWLLFVIDGASSVVFAVIIALGIKRETVRTAVPTGKTGGYGVVLRDKLMLAYIGLAFAAETVYALSEYALPLAIRVDGLSPAVYGVTAVVNAVLVVVLQPVIYPLTVKFGRLRTLGLSYVLVGVGVAATGLASSAWTYAATVAVWTVGEVFGGIVAGGIAADMAPAEAQGRYQGAMQWVSSLTRLAAPLLATALFGPALWWLTAAAGIGGALVLARLGGKFKARLAAA
ncbi:MFS transporter [Actinorhabdospora filicis]|uniref:MFS transporter n=1 Tax=Actinorhabdospora filicis TaxID=1785913 RepID=A0A9W6STX1_9ACTN|nr:MFS transporter [Actinorhabdospora filicis]GLZ80666.1 MFS transporter [Actinorhabdospora filicis]